MEKTAIQELEDAIQKLSSLSDLNKMVIKHLMFNFKIKEKQQIIDAVTYGNRQEYYDGTEELGKQYYNEKHGKPCNSNT